MTSPAALAAADRKAGWGWLHEILSTIGTPVEHPDAQHLAAIPLPITFPEGCWGPMHQVVDRGEWEDRAWNRAWPDGTMLPRVEGDRMVIASLIAWAEIGTLSEFTEFVDVDADPKYEPGTPHRQEVVMAARHVRHVVGEFVQTLRRSPGIFTHPE